MRVLQQKEIERVGGTKTIAVDIRVIVVEREIILHPHGPLTFEHISPAVQSKTRDVEEQWEIADNLDEVIRHHIQRVLDKTQGKVHGPGGAAELLGINANTLRNRMNKLGIMYGRKRR